MATNSQGKIDLCKKKTETALRLLVRNMKEIEGGELVYPELLEMSKVLETPEEVELQPLFDLANATIMKVNQHLRAKSEKAVLSQFERLMPKLARYAAKMANGASLQSRMAVCAADVAVIGEMDNLQPFFVFFEEVWGEINLHENEVIVYKITRARDGWLGREGEVGRFAEPFGLTRVPNLVSAWLTSKPQPGADHREFKTWRDSGYTLLKGELDHPWGMCPKCHSNKLMPWQDAKTRVWKANELCRDCYQAQKPAQHGGQAESHVMDELHPVVIRLDLTPEQREQVELSRAEEKARLKASQKAKKQAAKRVANEDRDDEDGVRPGKGLTQKDIAENQKLMAEALARSKSNAAPDKVKKASAPRNAAETSSKKVVKTKRKGGKQSQGE